MINDGRGQTLASNFRRSDSIGKAASVSNLCEASQTLTIHRAEQRSSRENLKPEPDPLTDNLLTTPPPEGTVTLTPQYEKLLDNLGQTMVYQNDVFMNNALRDKVVSSGQHPSDIPSLGKVNPNNSNIYVYARCVLTVPGELTTKTVTNPHVIRAFKFSVPDIYDQQGQQWYWSPQYIQALVNSGQTVMETCFPFTAFQHLGVQYTIEPQNIFFNYTGQDEYLFHRINLVHIKSLDPTLRMEHLRQSVPLPVQYRTPTGTIYHACFDITYSVTNVTPKHTRDLPGNQNEAIFMDNVNHLATTRTESLTTLSKLLQIYNDYRVNVFRKPQPFFASEGEAFILPVPPAVDPVTNQPINTPARGGQQNIPMPNPLPKPTSQTERERQQILELNQQTLAFNAMAMRYAPHHMQELFNQSYPSPYEEAATNNRPNQRKHKRKNVQLDPTIPWQPGNPRL